MSENGHRSSFAKIPTHQDELGYQHTLVSIINLIMIIGNPQVAPHGI